MSRSISTEGFVLARRDYGEADRIIVIFTKDFGKISYIAKGVRRMTSRKRGALEIFTKVRFSAAGGRGFPVLTEAVSLRDYGEIRESLPKVSVAYYMMELVGRMTRDEEKHPEVYKLIEDSLNELQRANLLRALRKNFSRRLLIHLGFWPEDKELAEPDVVIEEVLERRISSIRVGKKVLT